MGRKKTVLASILFSAIIMIGVPSATMAAQITTTTTKIYSYDFPESTPTLQNTSVQTSGECPPAWQPPAPQEYNGPGCLNMGRGANIGCAAMFMADKAAGVWKNLLDRGCRWVVGMGNVCER